MYLTHADLSKYWVVDVEADSLKPSRIWVVCVQNVATLETAYFRDRTSFRAWLDAHRDSYLVGHNAISFDVPVLNRLWNAEIATTRVVDTLVLSYLYDPSMAGGHGLEAWGIRLKIFKGDFSDFSQYSEEMLKYCQQDVWLTLNVFLRLTARMRKRGFSERSCRLEHEIRVVVDKQQENGFYFDIRAATSLYQELRGGEERLAVPIRELFPARLVSQGSYQYRLKADGTPFASYQRHLDRYAHLKHGDDGTYEVFELEDFNLGSPKQRVERLISLGYKPTKFTPTKQPKVDEESLVQFAEASGHEAVRALAEWLVYNGRANMINTWLNAVDRTDSRMHGRVFTCGAGTRRMRHANPNTANIPGNEARFGHECRALWGVADATTRRLVGYDAKALEMRCFGHYLNNPDAARLYVEGDPHSVNAASLEIERRVVKTIFYAFLYGASDGKLQASAGKSKGWGKWARAKLLETTPGLKKLVDQVQAEFNNGGFIETIDGGYVRCPSEHAALNYKLQSAGGIVMKQASIFIDRRVIERGIDSLKVGDIHDEGQHDVCVKEAEEFGELAVQAIRDAGEELGFRVPLDGDYKIGTNWAQTH